MYKLPFLWYNRSIIREEEKIIMKKLKVQILEAEQFACDNYNIPRQEFVGKACQKYPLLEHTYQFRAAIQAFDTIQREMKEVA